MSNKRNLIKELNSTTPAALHAKLGDLLEGITQFLKNVASRAVKFSLGAPIAASATAFISAATSTELPNNATITYTGLTDNTSPLDGAIAAPTSMLMGDGQMHLVWINDVPRALAATVSHASSVVAMTITLVGFDLYKNPLTETLTIAATGTSQSAAGKKAIKYLKSISITSAGNATTNTLNLGFSDVLGLPYAILEKADVLKTFFNDVEEATLPTIVVADTAAPSATTGDPRGTIDLNSALNGSAVRVWQNVGADYVAALGVTPLSER